MAGLTTQTPAQLPGRYPRTARTSAPRCEGRNTAEETVMNLTNAHLRVARSTDKLAEVVKFYKGGLGFEVLYQFHRP